MVIASSISQCRTIASSSSRHRHRSKHQWCEGVIEHYVALSGFHRKVFISSNSNKFITVPFPHRRIKLDFNPSLKNWMRIRLNTNDNCIFKRTFFAWLQNPNSSIWRMKPPPPSPPSNDSRLTAAVAQWDRTFAPQAEGWVLKSQT